MNLLKALNSKKGRWVHRWLSIIVAAYVIMATTSGVIHIIMANFYSPPPPAIPQGLVKLERASLPLSEIVKKIPAGQDIKAINIRTVNDDLWYQVVTGEGKPVYINAGSGKIDNSLDESYAKQIAADYLKKTALRKHDYLTVFNNEYLNIYRMLPVYRFDANENGERVYVSTITGSVTLYLNNVRSFGQSSFTNLHKLAFIPNRAARDILQIILVIGIIVTTLIGIGIFIARLKKP